MLLCIQALGVLHVALQLLSLLRVQIADCYKYMSWPSGIWLGETYMRGPKPEGAKERSWGVYSPRSLPAKLQVGRGYVLLPKATAPVKGHVLQLKFSGVPVSALVPLLLPAPGGSISPFCGPSLSRGCLFPGF